MLYDFTHMWKINNNKQTDTENRLVVTRGDRSWRENETGKEGHL